MRLLIIFLALFVLNQNSTYAIDNTALKTNKVSFNQAKQLTFGYPPDINQLIKDTPDINRFINATVELEVNEVVRVKGSYVERANHCMGIIIDNKQIYTAFHCLYSSNNADRNIVIEVFDLNRIHHLATIEYKTSRRALRAFYQADCIQDNQDDFLSIPLKTPLNPNGNALITMHDIIQNGTSLTALLTCSPAFANLNVLDKIIESACKITPTGILMLQSAKNGGGYVIKQEPSLFFKHNDSSESRNFGYSPSFGIADHYTYPTKFLADLERESPNTFNAFHVTFGAFHYYDHPNNLTVYSYVNAIDKDPAWDSSLKYLLVNNHPLTKSGDSGGPVIACDSARILREDRQANCYLIGLIVSSPHDHEQAVADFIRGFVKKP